MGIFEGYSGESDKIDGNWVCSSELVRKLKMTKYFEAEGCLLLLKKEVMILRPPVRIKDVPPRLPFLSSSDFPLSDISYVKRRMNHAYA